MIYRESKVYFDGSHYIAIPHTNRPPSNRRKPVEEFIEVRQEQTGETDLEKNEEDADVSDSYVGPETLDLDCKSAVLMEAETGRILYAKK